MSDHDEKVRRSGLDAISTLRAPVVTRVDSPGARSKGAGGHSQSTTQDGALSRSPEPSATRTIRGDTTVRVISVAPSWNFRLAPSRSTAGMITRATPI